MIGRFQGTKKLLETLCLTEGKYFDPVSWVQGTKGRYKETKDKQFVEQYLWGLAQDILEKTKLGSQGEGAPIVYFLPFSPSNEKLNIN